MAEEYRIIGSRSTARTSGRIRPEASLHFYTSKSQIKKGSGSKVTASITLSPKMLDALKWKLGDRIVLSIDKKDRYVAYRHSSGLAITTNSKTSKRLYLNYGTIDRIDTPLYGANPTAQLEYIGSAVGDTLRFELKKEDK